VLYFEEDIVAVLRGLEVVPHRLARFHRAVLLECVHLAICSLKVERDTGCRMKG
jgi:hypothetical protein